MDQFLNAVKLPHGSEKPKLTIRPTGFMDMTPTELFVRGKSDWNMIKEYSEMALLLQDLGPRPWMNLKGSIDEVYPFMHSMVLVTGLIQICSVTILMFAGESGNQIIHNTQFKKKVSLEEQKAQKEDRFLRGRQITFMIYDYFRVTGAHDTVSDYVDLILCHSS